MVLSFVIDSLATPSCWFLLLRVFGLLSSYLLLFPQQSEHGVTPMDSIKDISSEVWSFV